MRTPISHDFDRFEMLHPPWEIREMAPSFVQVFTRAIDLQPHDDSREAVPRRHASCQLLRADEVHNGSPRKGGSRGSQPTAVCVGRGEGGSKTGQIDHVTDHPAQMPAEAEGQIRIPSPFAISRTPIARIRR